MSTAGFFADAFFVVLRPENFVFVLVGVSFGMILGILPGLGGVVGMALLIPFIFPLDPVQAFLLLIATKAGTNFAGSVTAILLNIPGIAPNAATLLDGYPMAQNGEGRRAIGASAAASAMGAIFGIVVLTATIPIMREVVLLFTSPEVFWLGVWGITVVSVVIRGNTVPGLISGGLGLVVAMHGLNGMSANLRWTYGANTLLYDGFQLVPVLLGLFAIGEMMKLTVVGGSISSVEEAHLPAGGDSSVWQGVRDVFENKSLLLRSSIIGSVIGMIPGVGGVTANFLAYFQAAQTVRDPHFGEGDVRGVIASEASNDAKDGGALVPTLGLGIPGSATMAILLGAFSVKGISPGPFLLQQHLDVIAVIIVALLFGNVLTSLIGVTLSNRLVSITRIDVRILAPIVLALALTGSFSSRILFFDVATALLLGVLGFTMIAVNMSRVPFVLAFILAPIIERGYFRSLQVSSGDPTVFVASPISKLLVAVILLTLFAPAIRRRVAAIRGSDDRLSEELAESIETPEAQVVTSRRVLVGFYALVGAWVVGLLLLTAPWEPIDYLLPRLSGGLLLSLVVLQLLVVTDVDAVTRHLPRGLAAQAGQYPYPAAEEWRALRRRYLHVAGAVLAFPVLIYLVGFLLAIPLFVYAFVQHYLDDRRTSIVAAASIAAFTYVMFVAILDISLWPGLVFVLLFG